MLTGPGPADPRSLVRVGAAQGDAGHRRHHRRLRRAVDAGHRLRAVPPRHGRDQRQARRLGLRHGRHGRPDPGAGAGRQGPRRRDPHRRRGGPHPRRRTARSTGVALADGDEFRAPKVASNADPRLTFNRLLDPKWLPPDFAGRGQRIGYDSASLKINVALSELPNFTAPARSRAAARSIAAPSTSAPTRTTSSAAYDDAKYGRPSRNPILECTMPSAGRSTAVAPPGKHLMSMFIQYAPYKLKEGNWDEPRRTRSPTAASTSLERVRAELQAVGDRPPGAVAARPGADVQPDRRQHLPGRDDA